MPDLPTTRIALIKPFTSENKQLAVINSNSDKIDAAVGMQWVTDGALPAIQFHGAVFKELTSNRQFILKNDGLGGFTKVEISQANVGVIRHYFKQPVSGAQNVSSPANTYQKITGSLASWNCDRPGLAWIRITCDVTPHSGANSVKFRQNAFSYSETGSLFPPAGRQSVQISNTIHVTEGVLNIEVDFFNFTASGNSTLNEIKVYVDTNAVLT